MTHEAFKFSLLPIPKNNQKDAMRRQPRCLLVAKLPEDKRYAERTRTAVGNSTKCDDNNKRRWKGLLVGSLLDLSV